MNAADDASNSKQPAHRLPRRDSGSLSLILSIALLGLGLSIFARGFFPVKSHLEGYGSAMPLPTGGQGEEGEQPFGRLVFMLIDALRSDLMFAPSSPMTFAQQLIASGHGLPYTAIAQAPTVTLPRLKALTTGSNPTFLDAMLNLSEDDAIPQLGEVDSWVRQLKMTGKKMAFTGDDTWLRLFPEDWWSWKEGVSSFFVADTVSVDTNVTRHLEALLAPTQYPAKSKSTSTTPPNDWDVLILHYLGLDHVGHLGGPDSQLMAPKQREMDDVLKRVFECLTRRDEEDGTRSLLIMVGDHGMTANGNHGGSSSGETSAALLIASPSLPGLAQAPPAKVSRVLPPNDFHYHEVVHQIDIVPTLAALFSFGIPTNSMGRLITSSVDRFFSPTWSSNVLPQLLSQNAYQLAKVLEVAVPGTAADMACSVSKDCAFSKPWDLSCLSLTELATFTFHAQSRLLKTFGDYQISRILLGLSFLFGTSSWLAALSWPLFSRETIETKILVGGGAVVYLASFFATSFVEEEHELWFFGTAGLALWLGMRSSRKDRMYWMILAITVRLMRAWSPNGQKLLPNHSIFQFLSSHPTACLSALLLHPFQVFASLARASLPTNRGTASTTQLAERALGFAVLMSFALVQTLVVGIGKSNLLHVLDTFGVTTVTLTRIGYILGGIQIGMAKWLAVREPSLGTHLSRVTLSTLGMVLISLTRTFNLPLFVLLRVQVYCVFHLQNPLSPLLLATLAICLQQVAFFAFGGSNSLATVDLSQAYNGISAYSLPLVTLQTFASNFAGPIFISIATRSQTSFLILATFRAWSLTMLSMSATHFRRHLFTWTVFSPALVYKAVWVSFVLVGVDGFLSVLV